DRHLAGGVRHRSWLDARHAAQPGDDAIAPRPRALDDAWQAVQLHVQQRAGDLVHAQVLADHCLAGPLARSPDTERELAALVLVLVAPVEDLEAVGDEAAPFARGDVLG